MNERPKQRRRPYLSMHVVRGLKEVRALVASELHNCQNRDKSMNNVQIDDVWTALGFIDGLIDWYTEKKETRGKK